MEGALAGQTVGLGAGREDRFLLVSCQVTIDCFHVFLFFYFTVNLNLKHAQWGRHNMHNAPPIEEAAQLSLYILHP